MLPLRPLLLWHKGDLEGRQRVPGARPPPQPPDAAGHGSGCVTALPYTLPPPGVAFVVSLSADNRANHRQLRLRSPPRRPRAHANEHGRSDKGTWEQGFLSQALVGR